MSFSVDAITLGVLGPDQARRFYTQWGGYSGYLADPDGFLWKVACA